MIEKLFIEQVGRLVGGHPLVAHPSMDRKTGLQKTFKDGSLMTEVYFAAAIPKNGEQNWNQTPWGQQIYAEAQAAWPNGEYGAPTFAFKIIDGDSQIPNKRGKKPCDREGWPGHWILNCGTVLPAMVKCHHVGKYSPHEQIQDRNEIKTGDYCRVVLQVKGNDSTDSPGIYLNPIGFELCSKGQAIHTDSSATAQDMFGGAAAPVMPAGAQLDTNVAAPPVTPAGPAGPAAPAPTAPGVTPAPDFVANAAGAPAPPAEAPAPVMYVTANGPCTKETLLAAKWTEEQIAALPTA